MGFDYFDETTNSETIKSAFLVALHGSTNKKVGSGYKIVIMRRGEENQDFINGFLQDKAVMGRPCGIMKLDAQSFLFTDDFSGVIYYVRKKGSMTKISSAPEAQESLIENTENANAKQPESAPKSENCFGVAALLFGIFLRLIF